MTEGGTLSSPSFPFAPPPSMLHGVCMKDGKASYVNRLVSTSRLQQEAFYGAPKFIKVPTPPPPIVPPFELGNQEVTWGGCRSGT